MPARKLTGGKKPAPIETCLRPRLVYPSLLFQETGAVAHPEGGKRLHFGVANSRERPVELVYASGFDRPKRGRRLHLPP